jgi:hypothetical protein
MDRAGGTDGETARVRFQRRPAQRWQI